jgi:O-antigen ligase
MLNRESLFLNIVFIYFLFLPVSLILGNAIINIFILSFLIIVFIYSIFINDWKFLIFKNQGIFYLLCIYLIFSSIFVHDINFKNIIKSFSFGFYFLFAISFSYYLRKVDLDKIKIASYFFFSVIVFIYFDLIFQFLNPEFKDVFGFKVSTIRSFNIAGVEVLLPIRLSGPFKNELVPGFYLSTLGFIFIVLFFKVVNYRNKQIYLNFFLILNLIFIILTGERSSMIIAIIFLIFYFFSQKIYLKKKLLNIFMLLFLFFTIVTFLPTANERFRDLKNWSNSKDTFFKSFLTTEWGRHYQIAYKMTLNNPFFGSGIRTFRHECKKYEIDNKGCSTHPHNYILEITSETGIVFLVFFFTFIYKFLREFLIKKNITDINLYFIFIFISYLFPFRPTGSIFSSWYGSFFWILIFFIIFSEKIDLKKLNEK